MGNIITEKKVKVIEGTKHPVKFTALIYLREALLQEKFEDCSLFIQIAYEFGARDHEIESLLEDARRMPRL
ncbi:MAG: hypothetical protein EXS63_00200 [Candidatus Omnitrophica bacterium]|nr:hypothetical protein [Candidatus Omnitrophota bacterium]